MISSEIERMICRLLNIMISYIYHSAIIDAILLTYLIFLGHKRVILKISNIFFSRGNVRAYRHGIHLYEQ